MQEHSSAISALVYESVRRVTRLVGSTTDAILAKYAPMEDKGSSQEREAVLAALNGLMGDYLAATGNPLAIPMRLRRNGQALTLKRKALSSSVPPPRDKLLVLVHGLCMNDLQWTRKGSDFGVALARDLGYTPIHLYYNSGLHTSTNGRSFAALIETLLQEWPEPLKDFGILAHSMGGLVSRSAYHYGLAAGQVWPRHLRKLVFLGTPHHGALLERGGNWMNLCLGLSVHISIRPLGQVPQRWHHGPTLWQCARRRLARVRPLRACGRPSASGATAERNMVLCDCCKHRPEGWRSFRGWDGVGRQRSGSPRRSWRDIVFRLLSDVGRVWYESLGNAESPCRVRADQTLDRVPTKAPQREDLLNRNPTVIPAENRSVGPVQN